jgi:hypothetical protein
MSTINPIGDPGHGLWQGSGVYLMHGAVTGDPDKRVLLELSGGSPAGPGRLGQ